MDKCDEDVLDRFPIYYLQRITCNKPSKQWLIKPIFKNQSIELAFFPHQRPLHSWNRQTWKVYGSLRPQVNKCHSCLKPQRWFRIREPSLSYSAVTLMNSPVWGLCNKTAGAFGPENVKLSQRSTYEACQNSTHWFHSRWHPPSNFG